MNEKKTEVFEQEQKIDTQVPKKKGKRSLPKNAPRPQTQVSQETGPIGRPTTFTKEIAQEICKRISFGESLLQICKADGMPHRSTVHEWILQEDKKEFADNYARARELQAEFLFDEILEISDEAPDKITGEDKSDNARVQAVKLRVDTRKFYISKVLPKKYGDKVDVTSDGKRINTTPNEVILVNFGEQKNDAEGQ